MSGEFRFSFGPWNIHEGGDPFGPAVRESVPFNRKLAMFRKLGFGAVQFHDDDAVPGLNGLSQAQIVKRAKAVRRALERHGLVAEFVAPRLWEDPNTIDGAYTSNDAKCRRYAIDRSKRCIDIARELGVDLLVLWLAREGTYLRESKDPVVATQRLIEAINEMLAYDTSIRVAIEPKPNEPMDQAYIPTTGHALALASRTADPSRVGVNIESAHAVLAGLDPSDEMAFALSFGKLWTVHLNDQNGLKFDEDRAFGAIDLRRAFNQVRVLDEHDYGKHGEWVGLDVKAIRTQKDGMAVRHLTNSRKLFVHLLEVRRSMNRSTMQAMISARDYEALDMYIIKSLMGRA
jgi:xylose isomerase